MASMSTSSKIPTAQLIENLLSILNFKATSVKVQQRTTQKLKAL
jgi:hypothetical protein